MFYKFEIVKYKIKFVPGQEISRGKKVVIAHFCASFYKVFKWQKGTLKGK